MTFRAIAALSTVLGETRRWTLLLAAVATVFQISCTDDSDTGPGPTPVPTTVTDIDGNVYQTVIIGNQIWIAENLKVTHYRDGSPVPRETDDILWAGGAVSGAYCDVEDDTASTAIYGLLYNWYAVNDSAGLAPQGWRVATDDDWKELETYLGMSQAAADSIGFRGVVEGGKLKEAGTIHWYSPNRAATDEVGFTALPGGLRVGAPSSSGAMASFWTSSSAPGGAAWLRMIVNAEATMARQNANVTYGASVRCIME